ncbi:MAG: glycogen/starch synthase [Candidatus Saganbacteria bacterium]|nr:glycogen/starch synthase [Candidatus Saganbacteria bacterium]
MGQVINPLKVTWAAVRMQQIPRALAELGVDIRVVSPLFRETPEYLKVNGFSGKQEDLFSLTVRQGSDTYKSRIFRIKTPVDLYLVQMDDLFDREKRDGYPDDLLRFSVFCRTVFKLHHELNLVPDVLEGHGWETALLPVLKTYRNWPGVTDVGGNFFADTRTILSIHDFSSQREFNRPHFHEAGLGWEDDIPQWASFHARLNLLKAGLKTADLIYTSSREYLERVLAGEVTQRDFDGIVSERFENGKLVGLFEKDSEDQGRTPDEHARRILSVYRHIVGRPFGDSTMESAVLTSPPLVYEVLTPREKLEKINPEAVPFYNDLPAKDRDLVDFHLNEGRKSCFARVSSKKQMDDIISFLKIRISCDIEERLRSDGLGEVLDWFYPGDLDRLMSVIIDLGKVRRISIFKGMDKIGVVDHVIKVFKGIKLIASVQESTISALSQILTNHGHPSDTGIAGMSQEIPEFTLLSGIYHRFANDRKLFRAFILAVLLHDIGKLIKPEMHPEKGAMMLKNFPPIKNALKVLVDKEQYQFILNIILHHSTFGDSVVTTEANPKSIYGVFRLYSDDYLKRHQLFDSLILLGIADMDAYGDRGYLTPQKVRNLFRLYKALIAAKDEDQLHRNMARAGFAPDSWGNVKWNHSVIRERDNRRERERSRKVARKELVNYYRRIKISQKEFKRRLGSIEYTWRLQGIISAINDPAMRARFIFRIVELSGQLHRRRLVLDIKEEDMPKLLQILEKRNYDPRVTMRQFTHREDEESGAMIIGLP